MEGPGADSEEKRVLASDLDTVMVDSLKVLDLSRPIREADMTQTLDDRIVGFFNRSDLADPETARNAAIAQQRPSGPSRLAVGDLHRCKFCHFVSYQCQT